MVRRQALIRKLSAHADHWKLQTPFRIAGHEWTGFDIVYVEVAQDGAIGRGEAEGIYYFDETPATLLAQIEQVRPAIERGATRDELQSLLPRGGARCAIDCALWDLEAQLAGTSVWTLAGVSAAPLKTVYTIGIEPTPDAMAAKARETPREFPFKVKLDAVTPIERIAAIRRARPDAPIVVTDINQGWTFEQLTMWAPKLAELGVTLIEQPLPRDGDAALEGYRGPLPIFADESCLDRSDLDAVAKRYQGIVIKTDKAGGLTESLALAREAKRRDLRLMAGCMSGTSVMMAPTHVVAQLCEFADIDAPLLLAQDRPNALIYDGALVRPPKGGSWGA